MRRAGYNALVDQYVAQFNGQFKFFNEHLEDLGKDIGHKITVSFGQRDQDFFAGQQVNTIHLLEGVVDGVAGDAQRQAMLSVGGLKLSDLINEIADQFDKTLGEATTLADTAVSTFYRAITDRGFRIIERDLPEMEIRYKYAGPDDKLTRPFCERLLTLNGTY